MIVRVIVTVRVGDVTVRVVALVIVAVLVRGEVEMMVVVEVVVMGDADVVVVTVYDEVDVL